MYTVSRVVSGSSDTNEQVWSFNQAALSICVHVCKERDRTFACGQCFFHVVSCVCKCVRTCVSLSVCMHLCNTWVVYLVAENLPGRLRLLHALSSAAKGFLRLQTAIQINVLALVVRVAFRLLHTVFNMSGNAHRRHEWNSHTYATYLLHATSRSEIR